MPSRSCGAPKLRESGTEDDPILGTRLVHHVPTSRINLGIRFVDGVSLLETQTVPPLEQTS